MHALTQPPQPLALGSRASRLRASHSYGTVLALVVVTFSCAATLPDDDWTASVMLALQAATLVAALWTAGLTVFRSGATVAIAAFVAIVGIAQLLAGGERLTSTVALLTAALVVLTILAIVLGVMDQGEVNAQSVRGAICVYLLLGLFFVFVYSAVARLGDGAFFVQGTDGDRALRVYFSYVTLATLGYGDYTPAGDLGRAIAIVEALLGQLYLVTVLALLVSRIGLGGPLSPREDDAPRDGRP